MIQYPPNVKRPLSESLAVVGGGVLGFVLNRNFILKGEKVTSAIDKWRQVRLKVWGENACFTRPEMKVERVSYDVMTPSAARGILEAVLWKPAIRWVVEQIDVLAPIRMGRVDDDEANWAAIQSDPRPVRFASVRRNEVGCVFSASNKEGFFVEEHRQQRAGLILCNVAYLIRARFEMTEAAGSDDNVQKFSQIFRRRAEKGQCFHRPYLGCREFPASFELVDFDAPAPEPILEDRDLGWMFYDFAYHDDRKALFFRAGLDKGRMTVPGPESREVVS